MVEAIDGRIYQYGFQNYFRFPFGMIRYLSRDCKRNAINIDPNEGNIHDDPRLQQHPAVYANGCESRLPRPLPRRVARTLVPRAGLDSSSRTQFNAPVIGRLDTGMHDRIEEEAERWDGLS